MNSKNNSFFFENIPDMESTIKFINHIKSLKLIDWDIFDFEKLINSYFPVIPFPTVDFIPRGTILFRARLNDKPEPFFHEHEIFAPPETNITKFGRANYPMESVFYCSENANISIQEVIQELKNNIFLENKKVFITIGEWYVMENLRMCNIVHSKKVAAQRYDLLMRMFDHHGLLIKAIKGKEFDSRKFNSHNLICEFFANEFSKQTVKCHHDYKISAYYSKQLSELNNSLPENKFDGLNYASTKNKYLGDNQSIFIGSAKSKLKLINANFIICSDFDFHNNTFNKKNVAKAESLKNGKLNWIPYLN